MFDVSNIFSADVSQSHKFRYTAIRDISQFRKPSSYEILPNQFWGLLNLSKGFSDNDMDGSSSHRGYVRACFSNHWKLFHGFDVFGLYLMWPTFIWPAHIEYLTGMQTFIYPIRIYPPILFYPLQFYSDGSLHFIHTNHFRL